MPKFLENALRHEGRKKGLTGKHLEKYVYGGMNNIGAMHGSKETPKGAEMEKKHMAKEAKKSAFHMTHITHHDDGSHSVEHVPHMKMKGSGAFVDRGESTSYSAGNGNELVSKMSKHLGIGAAPAAGTQEKEVEPAPHEPPHEKDAAEEELSEGE